MNSRIIKLPQNSILLSIILFTCSCYIACSSRDMNEPVQPDSNVTMEDDSLAYDYVIAFGSCNDEDDPQSYWHVIGDENPDVWIWMGDIIYADTEDMAVMKAKYDMQKSNAYYKQFADSTLILGIWDDHDYGQNDGNKLYPEKKESKELLMSFLDVPETQAVHSRDGAYQSYMLGNDSINVKIILLDTRYFQDPLEKNPSGNPRYLLNEGDILGEAQWQWLASELKPAGQHLNIIVSSIQFLANEQIFEKWGNFPNAHRRMLDVLIDQQDVPSVILSGDRHIGEISRTEIEGLSYPLYDITSSGLTHSYEQAVEENEYRQGPLVRTKNFGLLLIEKSGDDFKIKTQIKNIDGSTHVERPIDILN